CFRPRAPALEAMIDKRGLDWLNDIEWVNLGGAQDDDTHSEAPGEIVEKRARRFRERGRHGSHFEAEDQAPDCVVRRIGAPEQLRIEEQKHLSLHAQI